MRFTEAEARKIMCPLVMANSWDSLDDCRGHRCMAWRWVPDVAGETMKKVGDEYFGVGFCGLAGQPRGVE